MTFDPTPNRIQWRHLNKKGKEALKTWLGGAVHDPIDEMDKNLSASMAKIRVIYPLIIAAILALVTFVMIILTGAV